MDKVRVKVHKVSSNLFWYKGTEGNTFELIKPVDSDKELFWTREHAGYINFILKEDAEVVE